MTDSGNDSNEMQFLAEPGWMTASLVSFNQLVAQNRLGHAYLVTSEDPLQAALFSQLVAARQLCQTGGQSPCGSCLGCRSFRQGTHGDMLEVRAESGKSAIGIDQVRAASKFLQQTALYGQIKILIMERAENMTPAAANSLLKTLEEPSGNSLLLLSVGEAWRLPATVRSRCQLVNLALPRQEDALSWLIADHGFDTERAAAALSLHQGRAVFASGMDTPVAGELLLALRKSFVDVTEAGDGGVSVPAVWAEADASVLVYQMMSWCEQKVRATNLSELRSQGRRWLLLHRCLTELWSRLRAGATPSKEILSAEIYRLCRSLPHPQFRSVAEVFLIGLGKHGIAG
jgi:DNA polymerase-3 subunit delta'